ncbi:MAG: hypothetical protein J6V88_05120 [Kiritimatiellae bacterium]|nr:hypothetical protein [Kiritimatiellia bacterium]
MSDQWYVKNSAGKTFGPITLDKLKEWVRDGRIEPLAGISSDLKSWILAPMKPELEMNWVIENNPGQFYGPTHRNVINDLIKAGSLSPSVRFFFDDRGHTEKRIQEMEQMLEERDKTIAARELTIQELQKTSKRKDEQLAETQKVIQQCEARLSEAQSIVRQKDLKIKDKDDQLADKDKMLFDRDAIIASKDAELRVRAQELAKCNSEISSLKNEISKANEVHDRQWETQEVLLPEIISNEPPPPVAHKAFNFGSMKTLADLERQAQEELSRIGGAGAFFNK